MILQPQSKPAVATPEALLFTAGFLNDSLEPQRPIWIYRDHQGKLQGPFSASSMLQWYSTGRLPQDLLVCGVAKATAQQTALELIPASCFRPLNQLVASAAQGIQYQPVSVAARQQPAGMQVVQGLPQAAAMRPTMVGGQQQISMLPAQPAQGAMTLPAVRPAAPQLQQAFRPAGVGLQQVVQLQNAAGVVQQQPNLVMMQQQQQPQQVLITSQQQAAPAMQPVMLMPQQQQQMQPRPIILQQPQPIGPRPQLQQPVMQQQQQQGQPIVLQQVPAAARMAAPQQVPGGVALQQPGSMQMPLQQQGMLRPTGVPGVSMPGPAIQASTRPGQPILLKQQQQQPILQGAGAAAKLQQQQPPGVALMQQQQQPPQGLAGTAAAAAAPASGDAATAHVAQRLEHLAAQAHQHVRPAGPVPPPISVSTLGGPTSTGPNSARLAVGPLSAGSLGGGSATNSFNNLDQLVRQANAAAAASGPSSAGAPAGLLPHTRTDRRSSAGGAAEPAAAGGLMGLHLTPREGSMLSAGGCCAAACHCLVAVQDRAAAVLVVPSVCAHMMGHQLLWRFCFVGTGGGCMR